MTMWTLKSIGHELGVSGRTLTRLARSGAFPPARAKGRIRKFDDAARVRVIAAWRLHKKRLSGPAIARKLAASNEKELYALAELPLPDRLKPPAPPAPAPAPPITPAPAQVVALASASSSQSATWLRMPLADGVELHVRLGSLDMKAIESLTSALGKVIS
ncbi:MAG: hypothetical protein JNM69_19830 [Archangium sp.]|nr:hypothetical protein [Archangium sp.]